MLYIPYIIYTYVILYIVTYILQTVVVMYSGNFNKSLSSSKSNSCSLRSRCGPGSGLGASGHYTEQSNPSMERLPPKNEEGQMATDCSGT